MKEIIRIAEICIEFDKRIADVGLAFARVEFAKRLAEVEESLAENEAELALNAMMLARQCDFAREAETKLEEYKAECERLVNDQRHTINLYNELRGEVRRLVSAHDAKLSCCEVGDLVAKLRVATELSV